MGLILASYLLGSGFSGSPFLNRVEAAPADVFGSPNVAIDTYRNSAGHYVLWSDGRITDTKGGEQDLGHPYEAPSAAAEIAPPHHQRDKALGSPHVAVKAIPRSDATYVLFSDGSLKLPANHQAAEGTSGESNVIHGIIQGGPSGAIASDLYDPIAGGIRMREALGSKAVASAVFAMAYTEGSGEGASGPSIRMGVIQGAIADDRRTVYFNVPNSVHVMASFLIVDR